MLVNGAYVSSLVDFLVDGQCAADFNEFMTNIIADIGDSNQLRIGWIMLELEVNLFGQTMCCQQHCGYNENRTIHGLCSTMIELVWMFSWMIFAFIVDPINVISCVQYFEEKKTTKNT